MSVWRVINHDTTAGRSGYQIIGCPSVRITAIITVLHRTSLTYSLLSHDGPSDGILAKLGNKDEVWIQGKRYRTSSA